MTPVVISDLCLAPSDPSSASNGRQGWLAFDLGPLHLRDVQLRKASSGRIYLSFEVLKRIDRQGRDCFALWPKDDDSRLASEVAIFTLPKIRPEEAAQ